MMALTVVDWAIDRVIPYARNPRNIPTDAIDAVKSSIREFGWRQPIVVDAGGVIVAGHTRYQAARQLGLATVPVHVASELTPTQIRAYRLADNRTSDNAFWDNELLTLELQDLRDDDFDIDLTAFTEQDLKRLLAETKAQPHSEFSELDESIVNDIEMMTCPSCGHRFQK